MTGIGPWPELVRESASRSESDGESAASAVGESGGVETEDGAVVEIQSVVTGSSVWACLVGPVVMTRQGSQMLLPR